MSKYNKKHYLKYKKAHVANTGKNRMNMRLTVWVIKENTPCVDCGRKYPHYMTHYDHLDASRKTKEVSAMINSASKENTFKEISKCELVCANCHAART